MPASNDSPVKLWMEQCAAAARIRDRFGLEKALDYIVGDKLVNYIDSPNSYRDWQHDLPEFVDEVAALFPRQELEDYFNERRRQRGGERKHRRLMRQARELLLGSQ